MKKTTFIIPVFTFAFSLFLFAGCHRKAEENALRFNSIHRNETVHLFNDTLKPACNLQIHFTYPDSAQDQLLAILQSVFTEKTFGASFQDLTPEEAVEVYIRRYFQNFKRFEEPEEFKMAFEPETNEDACHERKDTVGLYYYTRLTNQVVYNRNGFVSFTVQNICYEGGAHSSQSLYGYVIDLKNSRLLQEDDFAGNRYKQYIAPVLASKLALANGLENPTELENIGYFSLEDIVPNNNFTIDDRGITYYFNEGEIAGTVVGLIRVFIPYDEISVYLKDGSPI
jgi:hypothetical protein